MVGLKSRSKSGNLTHVSRCHCAPASGREINISDRESILRKIADAERQIAGLNQQPEDVAATLSSLRERLALYDEENRRHLTSPATAVVSTSTKLTPGDKIALFFRLFRGRDAVYPKLWQNQKTGKEG